jgi:hypothetical protein
VSQDLLPFVTDQALWHYVTRQRRYQELPITTGIAHHHVTEAGYRPKSEITDAGMQISSRPTSWPDYHVSIHF